MSEYLVYGLALIGLGNLAGWIVTRVLRVLRARGLISESSVCDACGAVRCIDLEDYP